MLSFSGYVFSKRCFSVIGDMLFVNIFVTFMIIVVVSCHGLSHVMGEKEQGVAQEKGFQRYVFWGVRQRESLVGVVRVSVPPQPYLR